MTSQDRMKSLLGQLGVPSKEIQVFGSQIIITCWSEEAARKFAGKLGRFAKVRGIVESVDYTKDPQALARLCEANPGLVKTSPVTHKVWRVGAYI